MMFILGHYVYFIWGLISQELKLQTRSFLERRFSTLMDPWMSRREQGSVRRCHLEKAKIVIQRRGLHCILRVTGQNVLVLHPTWLNYNPISLGQGKLEGGLVPHQSNLNYHKMSLLLYVIVFYHVTIV